MPLNIVCLHGFTQNATILKKKLSKLIKSTKEINLYFLEGSFMLDHVEQKRAYWIYNQDNPLDADQGSKSI